MRFDDGIPELDALVDTARQAEEHEMILEGEGMAEVPHARPSGPLLVCVEEIGEKFTPEQVAILMQVPVETVIAAVELRDGLIEGLHFQWSTSNLARRLGGRGP